MEVKIFDDKDTLGKAAAAKGATYIRKAIAKNGHANVIIATGASQFEMLSALSKEQDIDWSKVNFFHLDEYIGLPEDHPAGFRKYLRERFINKLPVKPASFHPVNGSDPDPEKVCAELGKEIANYPIDVAFVGIGENGHIAFNDPPVADFNDPKAVKIVKLDEICRMQQVHDGCFKTIDDVPTHALSLTVPTLCAPPYRFCVVPAATKANAVKHMLEDEIDEHCPCTVLRRTPGSFLYLDPDSSALYKEKA